MQVISRAPPPLSSCSAVPSSLLQRATPDFRSWGKSPSSVSSRMLIVTASEIVNIPENELLYVVVLKRGSQALLGQYNMEPFQWWCHSSVTQASSTVFWWALIWETREARLRSVPSKQSYLSPGPKLLMPCLCHILHVYVTNWSQPCVCVLV